MICINESFAPPTILTDAQAAALIKNLKDLNDAVIGQCKWCGIGILPDDPHAVFAPMTDQREYACKPCYLTHGNT